MGIYKEKRILLKEEEHLSKSSISDINKQYIMEFKSFLIASRIGILKTLRYMVDLRMICTRYKDKDFVEWNSKDIIEVLEKVEVEDLSDASKNEYRRSLRKFFKWQKGDEWAGILP